jgi:hypothetical protein
MEARTKKNEKQPENPRAQAIRRILSIAQLIRKNGTPDEADEAIEWERLLQKRLAEVEASTLATAA